MPVFNETLHAGGYLVSEANKTRSRDQITIPSGTAAMVAGTVLGKVESGSGTATAAAKSGGNTGGGTITMDGSTPVLANAKPGVYQVRCTATATNSGTFRVTDPSGAVIGDVVVGATFADEIKFAIADGTPDFAVGDGFDITTAPAQSGLVPLAPAATDGSQIAAGILFDAADASSAAVIAVAHTRACEVNGGELTWPGGITSGQKAAAIDQLSAAGIIVR